MSSSCIFTSNSYDNWFNILVSVPKKLACMHQKLFELLKRLLGEKKKYILKLKDKKHVKIAFITIVKSAYYKAIEEK